MIPGGIIKIETCKRENEMVPGRRKLRNHRESLELGGERNYREITEKA